MFQFLYVFLFILFGFNCCACLDSVWDSYERHLTKHSSRDELLITNVTVKEYQAVPKDVKKWTSLTVDSQCYSVGLMDDLLVVLSANLYANNSGFDVEAAVIEVESRPVDVALMEHKENDQSELIVIVALNSSIAWYKLQEKIWDQFWSWPLQKPLSHINTFKMFKHHKLLLILGQQHDTSAEIYHYHITEKNYWLEQSIPIFEPSNSSAINLFQFDYFLSITQPSLSKVLIFRHEENHFVEYKNLTSLQLNNVVSFEIGFKSFVAFDGSNASIYQFTENGLIKQTISNSSIEDINYITPLPMETYRDDTILLVQKEADHGSHKSFVLDFVTYNGLSFEEHEDFPCFYFGEEQLGLSCLKGPSGITGASYLALDKKLAILVPGKSDLYFVSSIMKQLESPITATLDGYEQRRIILEKKITSQLKRLEELQEKYKYFQDEVGSGVGESRSADVLKQITFEDLQSKIVKLGPELDELSVKITKAMQHEENQLETIIFNDSVEIEGLSTFEQITVGQIGEENATFLLNDIVQKDNIKPIVSNKTFTDIVIDSLKVEETINEVGVDKIIFNTPKDALVIHGDVTFNSSVNAQNVIVTSRLINDVLFEKEMISFDRPVNESLSFEHLAVEDLKVNKMNDIGMVFNKTNSQDNDFDTIVIPQNLTVKKINGIDFENFLRQLCLRNIKCYLPALRVKGKIDVEEDIYVETINDLKFPEEFVLNDDRSNVLILGKKNFVGPLIAKEIHSRQVDGINLDSVITLSTNQNLPGTIVFDDLQITEEFNVTGQTWGDYVKKFVPNYTLLDRDTIRSNVQFKELIVDGNIFIDDNFFDRNFLELMQDIIYKDEEAPEITAIKAFPLGFATKNLHLESKAINNILLSEFVTKNTDQVLNISTLNGIVNFENLFLEGLYGNINVTKLDQEVVKLTGEQFISSTLIFQDELTIKNLIIEDKLNDLTSNEYFYQDSDNEMEGFSFGDIRADNVLVEGDFEGAIENFNVEDYAANALSLTKDQEITEQYIVENLEANTLNVTAINGLSINELFNSAESQTELVKKILSNGAIIENLIVDGDLNFQLINNNTMNDFMDKLKSFGNKYEDREDLIFDDDVFFDDLQIRNLAAVDFQTFLNSIVFKNETDVTVTAPKSFSNGINVEKLIETNRINDVILENILTKHSDQEIFSNLVVHGDVVFENDVVVNEINGFNVSYVYDNFETSDGTNAIKGDVMFSRISEIDNLIVDGYTNGLPTNDVLSNAVYVNQDYTFTKDFTFEDNVTIANRLSILNNYNNVNWANILPKIVYIDKNEIIESVVSFEDNVYVRKFLKCEELSANTLLEINTTNWIENAIYINKGMLLGNYTFNEVEVNEFINTQSINEINMSNIIPLKQNQTLEFLQVSEATIANNVKVGNLVNGYNLKVEAANTLLTDSEQFVDSDITFTNKILIRNNIETPKINSLDVGKIVTTNTDQVLSGLYSFEGKTVINSNIIIDGTVNYINMSDWTKNSLKIFSPHKQDIFDSWNIKENITFRDGVYGNGNINNMDLVKVYYDIEEKSKYKFKIEENLIKDYTNMCKDVNHLYEAAKNQNYRFEYFNELQVQQFDEPIQNVFHIKNIKHDYLFVTEQNSCKTIILVFKYNQFFPVKTIEMGNVLQIVPIRHGDFLFLAVRSSNDLQCNIQGTNVWTFDGTNIEILSTIEDQDMLQESLVPGRFFGLDKTGVTEYNVIPDSEISVKKFRKWTVVEDNLRFVPRGLKTGLALCNGEKIIRLIRNLNKDDDNIYDLNTEVVITGQVEYEDNFYLPGQHQGDIGVLKVGSTSTRKSFLAVATHEDKIRQSHEDFIKIYTDVSSGKLFQNILTIKPSSLKSIDLENGQTLLVFIENNRFLDVYEYKGIEGFKHLHKTNMKATDLFLMTLPFDHYLNPRKVLGVVNENTLTLVEARMSGNKIREDLRCGF